MNFFVFLDAQAGELEKILSGTKSMVVKKFDPADTTGQAVEPGDSLYFLKNGDDWDLRVVATVVQVLSYESSLGEDLSHLLKEVQPKLQLTEEQYNRQAGMKRILLVEFASAHKIELVHVAADKIRDRSDWIAFEDFSLIKG